MMEIWYTARKKFTIDDEGWLGYMDWAKLHTVSKELITLDFSLCEPIIEVDFESENVYNVAVVSKSLYFTYCYNSLDFVVVNTLNITDCNILAVACNPLNECRNHPINNFVFVGYDLLDQSNDTSSLTNCGGFEDVFDNDLLNAHGLIDNFATASTLRDRLIEMHPEDHHADTSIWAI